VTAKHTQRAQHPHVLVLDHPRPLVTDGVRANRPGIAVVVLGPDDSLGSVALDVNARDAHLAQSCVCLKTDYPTLTYLALLCEILVVAALVEMMALCAGPNQDDISDRMHLEEHAEVPNI
jgi:hypothetical protein